MFTRVVSFVFLALPFIAQCMYSLLGLTLPCLTHGTAVTAASCSRTYVVKEGDICDGIGGANNVSTSVVSQSSLHSGADNLFLAINLPLLIKGPSTLPVLTSSQARLFVLGCLEKTALLPTLSVMEIPAMASRPRLELTPPFFTRTTLRLTTTAPIYTLARFVIPAC